MNIKLYQYFISIFLAFGIGYFLGHRGDRNTYIDNTLKSDTVVHEITHTIEHFRHDSTTKIIMIPDSIKNGAVVDTNFILNEYFTKHTIEDSVDTFEVKAKILSTLYGNEIISNVWDIQNTRKTNVTIKTPHLYIGISYDVTLKPTILYCPNRVGYLGQYDMKNKTIGVGILYNIR